MNTDIRLNIDFFENLKYKQLKRALGAEAILNLQMLWCWAAKNRADGALTGLCENDIEVVSNWDGEPNVFVKKLKELKLIDDHPPTDDGPPSDRRPTAVKQPLNGPTNGFWIHDWREHNPWAAEGQKRSDQSRFNRFAGVCPEIHAQMVNDGKTEISKADYERLKSLYGKHKPAKLKKRPQ